VVVGFDLKADSIGIVKLDDAGVVLEYRDAPGLVELFGSLDYG